MSDNFYVFYMVPAVLLWITRSVENTIILHVNFNSPTGQIRVTFTYANILSLMTLVL